MTEEINEPDWKVFRELREVALQRFCDKVLAEVRAIVSDPGQTSHQRYLAVYDLIHKRDKTLADMFNNPRRSWAVIHLIKMRAEGLLTDGEMSRFSVGTRDTVQHFVSR